MRYIIFILLIFAALLISACQRHVGDNLGQRSLEQSEIPHDLGYKSDFNQDCSVDLDDFFLLVDEINNFQSKDAVTLDYLYDLNGDSWVDREDFTLFSKAYGFKCEKIYPEDFEDCKPNQCSILIILDKNLEILLSDEINQFKADIQSDLDGYDVFVYIPNSNPTKEDVKAVIMQYYHDHYLKGAILVGDIPSAKYMDFSNSEYNRNFFFSQGYMVSDAYYRDIEGRSSVVKDGLIDLSKNKVGKYLNGLKPPFWIGRLTPPNNMNRVQALRNYFKKNHEYRTKSLSFEKRLLLYSPINVEFYPTLPEDDALMESYGSQIDLLKSYGVYENEDVTLMGYSKSPYYTDAIKEPYEYAFIESHGSPDTLYPGVTSDMIKNSNPLFYTFTGCSVGDFLNPNYISGYHLFNGNTLFVKACSIVHFDGDELEVPYLFALKNGVPIFKAQDLSTRGNMCYAWLGDPTLRMRDPVRDAAGDVPRIAFSVKQISLGDVTASYSLDEGYGNFKIFNDGNLPLIVYSISTRNTQNFYYVDIRLKDNKGMSINNLIIPSKQSREFQFFILPTDNDSVAGELLGEAYTLSNDPANPLVSLHYSGGVTKIIKESPGLRENAYMGIVMGKLKGKIDARKAMEIINKYTKDKTTIDSKGFIGI